MTGAAPDAPALFTLTTDFGAGSGYPAQMKGVLLSALPDARIVDVSHDVPRHDVLAGALLLEACVPWFPAGAVHVAVVDPGVGTARRALCVRDAGGRTLVAPDNGLAHPVPRAGRGRLRHRARARRAGAALAPPSTAATSSRRSPPSSRAAAIPRRSAPRSPTRCASTGRGRSGAAAEVAGETLAADPFGNLVTSIRAADLGGRRGRRRRGGRAAGALGAHVRRGRRGRAPRARRGAAGAWRSRCARGARPRRSAACGAWRCASSLEAAGAPARVLVDEAARQQAARRRLHHEIPVAYRSVGSFLTDWATNISRGRALHQHPQPAPGRHRGEDPHPAPRRVAPVPARRARHPRHRVRQPREHGPRHGGRVHRRGRRDAAARSRRSWSGSGRSSRKPSAAAGARAAPALTLPGAHRADDRRPRPRRRGGGPRRRRAPSSCRAPPRAIGVVADVPAGEGPAHAALVSLVAPGAARVAPPCRHFGPGEGERECGGCEWLHVGYPAQLAAKERDRARGAPPHRAARAGRSGCARSSPRRRRSATGRAPSSTSTGRAARLVFFRRRSHEPVRARGVPPARARRSTRSGTRWGRRSRARAARAAGGRAGVVRRRRGGASALLAPRRRRPRRAPGRRRSSPRCRRSPASCCGGTAARRRPSGDPVLSHERVPGDPAAGAPALAAGRLPAGEPRRERAARRGGARPAPAGRGGRARALLRGRELHRRRSPRRARAVAAVEGQGPALELARDGPARRRERPVLRGRRAEARARRSRASAAPGSAALRRRSCSTRRARGRRGSGRSSATWGRRARSTSPATRPPSRATSAAASRRATAWPRSSPWTCSRRRTTSRRWCCCE